MALRNTFPTASSIISVTDTATSGAVTYPFTVPQDCESIVAKVWLQSTWSASGTAIVFIQTTEDGGTTWRDVASTTIGASTVAASMGNQYAHFIPISLTANTDKGSTNYVGSVAASTISLAAVNASAVGITSGLPMMSTAGRIQIQYTATISTGGVNVQIFAPTQASHA